MTEKKTPKRRTQVKDLPKEEKELSKDEQKRVKGGARGLAIAIVSTGGGSGSLANQQDPEK